MTEAAWAPAVAAFLTAAALTEGFRRWAVRRALFDVPNARSSHAVPTPRGGGVGIVAGFFLGLALWSVGGGSLSPRAFGWLVGALLVAGVSFLDDLRPLPASWRLATHLVGALLLTAVGVQDDGIGLVLALPLAFGWVALVTNAYNFMDGIDGIAGGQAVVAGVGYALAGSLVGNPLVATAGLLLAAAAAGFLLRNLPPAHVFMGDVGSTFLGFTFAALPLLGSLGVGGGKLPLEFGLAALAPFLFDALVTLARRVYRRERWFEAHRSHYYQRLVQAGLSHRQVTLLYTMLEAGAVALALASIIVDEPRRQGLAVASYLPMLGVVLLVWRMERTVRPHVGNARTTLSVD